jgi:uncharacterized protein
MFEFDDQKSILNKEKHRIDFNQAQELWSDKELVILKAKTIDEQRFMAIGLIGDKYWSAIYTVRNDKIRIISVRRSRDSEVRIYEKEN